VFGGQYGLAALVENFQRPDLHAAVRLFVVALFIDCHPDADGVADEYQLDEAQPGVRALSCSHFILTADDRTVICRSAGVHLRKVSWRRLDFQNQKLNQNQAMKNSITCLAVASGRRLVYSLIAILAIGALTGCACTKGEKHHNKEAKQARLMAKAKVSRADAEKTALAKAPNGTIKEGELEKEKGRLIWSFDITTPDTKDITEVNVDAITGEVVSVEKESAANEAKEAAGEKK